MPDSRLRRAFFGFPAAVWRMGALAAASTTSGIYMNPCFYWTHNSDQGSGKGAGPVVGVRLGASVPLFGGR